jgi:Asp-tRNA(Asn)/Glu-tRNA(Gln) amidotransferase A subunit family amidase
LSALARPCGFLSSGVPMGVQFMTPAFHDSLVLTLGAQYHAELLREQIEC